MTCSTYHAIYNTAVTLTLDPPFATLRIRLQRLSVPSAAGRLFLSDTWLLFPLVHPLAMFSSVRLFLCSQLRSTMATDPGLNEQVNSALTVFTAHGGQLERNKFDKLSTTHLLTLSSLDRTLDGARAVKCRWISVVILPWIDRCIQQGQLNHTMMLHDAQPYVDSKLAEYARYCDWSPWDVQKYIDKG